MTNGHACNGFGPAGPAEHAVYRGGLKRRTFLGSALLAGLATSLFGSGTHATAKDDTTMSSLLNAGLFKGFRPLDIETPKVRFDGLVGGSGTPVLLLHGYPQTHAAWHAVAPALAERHTVVVPDLPGYGGSRTLVQSTWDKREVAAELVAMMRQLGHERFAVVSHDRGARVGYRLALDHPAAVTALATLAVVPTLDIWPAVDREFAKGAFHWFLFLQPDDMVEALLAGDPDTFIDTALAGMIGSLDRLHPAALDSYRTAFRQPSVRAAMIADYKAGYGSDNENDAADRKAGRRISCPVLALWAHERLVAEGVGSDIAGVEKVWRRWADTVSVAQTPGGHLIAEDAPEEALRLLLPFLHDAKA